MINTLENFPNHIMILFKKQPLKTKWDNDPGIHVFYRRQISAE